jgi:hypothetical protein
MFKHIEKLSQEEFDYFIYQNLIQSYERKFNKIVKKQLDKHIKNKSQVDSETLNKIQLYIHALVSEYMNKGARFLDVDERLLGKNFSVICFFYRGVCIIELRPLAN